jgi:hypothetical protein
MPRRPTPRRMRVLCSIADVCVLPFFEGKVLTSRVGERAVGMFAGVDLSKKSTGFCVSSCEIAILTKDDAVSL